ncbi:hypothetical protein, variant [Capsaspora owczarzaki ATCC 30864]|uniref:Mif2/CENP-C cupin domain-containing protein n=1 Tax=Capsaspora owczarzaki (strain ATCC 30864) TaxID=595528 RepID=A0A0D2VTS1_CAPO3|nr:hypothetical protein, variant [Capsaspora owczarzaki ATCC 30864]
MRVCVATARQNADGLEDVGDFFDSDSDGDDFGGDRHGRTPGSVHRRRMSVAPASTAAGAATPKPNQSKSAMAVAAPRSTAKTPKTASKTSSQTETKNAPAHADAIRRRLDFSGDEDVEPPKTPKTPAAANKGASRMPVAPASPANKLASPAKQVVATKPAAPASVLSPTRPAQRPLMTSSTTNDADNDDDDDDDYGRETNYKPKSARALGFGTADETPSPDAGDDDNYGGFGTFSLGGKQAKAKSSAPTKALQTGKPQPPAASVTLAKPPAKKPAKQDQALVDMSSDSEMDPASAAPSKLTGRRTLPVSARSGKETADSASSPATSPPPAKSKTNAKAVGKSQAAASAKETAKPSGKSSSKVTKKAEDDLPPASNMARKGKAAATAPMDVDDDGDFVEESAAASRKPAAATSGKGKKQPPASKSAEPSAVAKPQKRAAPSEPERPVKRSRQIEEESSAESHDEGRKSGRVRAQPAEWWKSGSGAAVKEIQRNESPAKAAPSRKPPAATKTTKAKAAASKVASPQQKTKEASPAPKAKADSPQMPKPVPAQKAKAATPQKPKPAARVAAQPEHVEPRASPKGKTRGGSKAEAKPPAAAAASPKKAVQKPAAPRSPERTARGKSRESRFEPEDAEDEGEEGDEHAVTEVDGYAPHLLQQRVFFDLLKLRPNASKVAYTKVAERERPETQSQVAITDPTGGIAQRAICKTPAMVKVDLRSGTNVEGENLLEMTRFVSNPGWGAGTLTLTPLALKQNQNVGKNTLLFFVVFGQLSVQIHGSSFIVSDGSFFYVPPNNQYELRNLLDGHCKLFFVQLSGLPATH